jgi:WD40 repeat protein
MGLGDSAEYSDLDSSLNIIHMLFSPTSKDCMIFARVEDQLKAKKQNLDIMAVPNGKIVVHHIEANISKETFAKLPQYDLYLRHEQVHHELNNIFAQFFDKCNPKAKYLYVCGYYDNSIRIFDIGQKDTKPGKHILQKLRTHNARVTCLKFSNDYRFFISCDADGVIHHYERICHSDSANMDKASNTTVCSKDNMKKKAEKNKEHFPFTLLYTVQD